MYFAGFAYSGDAAALDTRFAYTRAIDKSLTGQDSLPRVLARKFSRQKPQNFDLQLQDLGNLDEHAQAIAVALVMTSETVSVEPLDGMYKIYVHLRAQALFFDFKSKTILRAYPISAAFLDESSQAPTDEENGARVRRFLIGDEDGSLFSLFVKRMSDATIPANVPRYLQVTKVSIPDEVRKVLPPEYRDTPRLAETWLADTMAEELSKHADIPVLPYSAGYAIGNVMAARFSDASVYNLKIPEPDYGLTLDVTGAKKVLFGQVAAGSSVIYASYLHLRLEEPLSGKIFFDSALKNGATKVVPATQTAVDDGPAYADSFRGLLTNTALVLGGNDLPWLKVAAGAPDINQQVSDSRKVIQQCK